MKADVTEWYLFDPSQCFKMNCKTIIKKRVICIASILVLAMYLFLEFEEGVYQKGMKLHPDMERSQDPKLKKKEAKFPPQIIIGANTTETVSKTKYSPETNHKSPNRTKPKFLPVWEMHPPSLRKECLRKQPRVKEVKKEFPDMKTLDQFQSDERKNFKKILVWNNAYGNLHMNLGFGEKPFEKACCREHRCMLTANRNIINVTNFDAIIFHFRAFHLNDVPKQRKATQRWVFFEVESAAYLPMSPSRLNGIFNWTMTYRRDSDIYAGYNHVYPYTITGHKRKLQRYKPRKKILQEGSKNATIAWLVSHCTSLSHREKIVEKLQKYIKVDIYGKCSKRECNLRNKTECYKYLEKNYKFYLSFENSICKDYITEKLFNILKYDLVPVVLGAGDYSAVAPPHSYIDVRDFKDYNSLANYLLYLDGNQTAYNEYFRWREEYFVMNNVWLDKATIFCSLCERLHTDSEPKVYEDLEKWFLKDSNCKRLKPVTWLEKFLNISIKYKK